MQAAWAWVADHFAFLLSVVVSLPAGGSDRSRGPHLRLYCSGHRSVSSWSVALKRHARRSGDHGSSSHWRLNSA